GPPHLYTKVASTARRFLVTRGKDFCNNIGTQEPSKTRSLMSANADLLQEYEAKIAALERMVGRQALEIEFLKGALKNAARPRSVNTSVITGPAASPSQKDAG